MMKMIILWWNNKQKGGYKDKKNWVENKIGTKTRELGKRENFSIGDTEKAVRFRASLSLWKQNVANFKQWEE